MGCLEHGGGRGDSPSWGDRLGPPGEWGSARCWGAWSTRGESEGMLRSGVTGSPPPPPGDQDSGRCWGPWSTGGRQRGCSVLGGDRLAPPGEHGPAWSPTAVGSALGPPGPRGVQPWRTRLRPAQPPPLCPGTLAGGVLLDGCAPGSGSWPVDVTYPVCSRCTPAPGVIPCCRHMWDRAGHRGLVSDFAC